MSLRESLRAIGEEAAGWVLAGIRAAGPLILLGVLAVILRLVGWALGE